MKIDQLYTKCLSEASYYIESDGEAIVIDPIREPDPYLEMAANDNAKIKYIFETHFHADFVSGHIDLAKKTGATIVYGPGAAPNYETHVAKDGEVFQVGKIKVEVLHTPGHTPESSTYLLYDEDEKKHAVFTGDTLFIGDVGRPDLAVKSDLTQEDLAGMLYDSLNTKLKTLPDDVVVYPAHGAGSACGKNISDETESTIGQQKQFNYAMQDMSKEKFIEVVTEGLTAPPSYFFEDARINKEGYGDLDEVLKKNIKALTVNEFEKERIEGALVLDTRSPDEFEKGYISGSINIGLGGQYAIWAGTLIQIKQPIVIIAEQGKEEEAILRLARVGYENVKGFLKGGIAAWKEAGMKLERMDSIEAKEAVSLYNNGEKIIDVRKPAEVAGEHIPGALLLSLQDLEEKLDQLEVDASYLVHCAGGYRSMIAASILKKHGINHVTNVKGGMAKLKEAGVKLVSGVEI